MTEVKIDKKEYDRLMSRDKDLKKLKDKQKETWQRRNAKLLLMFNKATEKGLKVSEAEITEYLNKK